MENFWIVAIAVLAAGLAGAVGYLAAKSSGGRRKAAVIDEGDPVGNARVEAQRILARAEEEGRARADAFRQREEAALEHRRVEVDAVETRLAHREGTLEQRAANLAQREQILIQREGETSVRQQDLDRLRESARSELERISGVDAKAAKDELLAQVEHDGRRDAMILVRDL
ncbi:MAG: Rnase Y domain-containing protein, partial [Acidimicrobiia bacterium]